VVSIETILSDFRRVKKRVGKVLTEKIPKSGDRNIGGQGNGSEKALAAGVN
jgi:hypothetical protein